MKKMHFALFIVCASFIICAALYLPSKPTREEEKECVGSVPHADEQPDKPENQSEITECKIQTTQSDAMQQLTTENVVENPMGHGNQVENTKQDVIGHIDEKHALEIAINHFGDEYADRADMSKVERIENTYVVTIPFHSAEPPSGTRFRGPDFAAQVVVDSKTGAILKVIVGI